MSASTAISNVRSVPPRPARAAHWGMIARIEANDLEAAAEQMRSWSPMDYTRLDRQPATVNGFLLGLGPALVGRWGGTCAKLMRTHVPPDMVAILLPLAGFGRRGTEELVPGVSMLGNAGSEHVYFTNSEFEATLIATSQAKWSQFMDSYGLDISLKHAESRVLPGQPADTAPVQALVSEAERAATESPAAFGDAARREAVEDRLLAGIARVLGLWREPFSPPQRTAVARHRAALRAREYIDAHLDQSLSLASVCRASFTSARALEYAFRELFGVSPMAYARCARLARVRRDLLHVNGARPSVTETATRWGFWHLGQFSKDYSALFGELPSTTLGRARA